MNKFLKLFKFTEITFDEIDKIINCFSIKLNEIKRWLE